ncbi:MAG TPA: FAD-binding oxidoreductase [Acidobacteriota bacterium]|nr:FAD-binding oxidoreductase [Acidobacteriota bacterium]
MKDGYEVVIVGAGIIGLSIAYNLAKEGCTDILVMEKEPAWITGSSARANGGFRQQFSTEINIRLSQLSLPVFETFEEEFGIDIGLRQYGYLFLASSQKVLELLDANRKLQLQLGVPVDFLTSPDLASQYPFLRTDDLKGGNFCAKDGYADPYSIALGFGSKAFALGVELKTGLAVTKILHRNQSILGVATPQGTVSCQILVNAAGPYAAQVAGLAGEELPIEPVRRMIAMTEPFPEIPERIPMIIDLDTGFLARKEAERVVLAWADPDEPPGFNLSFDPSFIEIVAEKAVRRIPALAQAKVNPQKSWAGLYAVTPDHHCILGESSKVKNLFHAVGFSGHGMMHAPAVGRLMSELILRGKAESLDIGSLGPSRFAEGKLVHERVVL